LAGYRLGRLPGEAETPIASDHAALLFDL